MMTRRGLLATGIAAGSLALSRPLAASDVDRGGGLDLEQRYDIVPQIRQTRIELRLVSRRIDVQRVVLGLGYRNWEVGPNAGVTVRIESAAKPRTSLPLIGRVEGGFAPEDFERDDKGGSLFEELGILYVFLPKLDEARIVRSDVAILNQDRGYYFEKKPVLSASINYKTLMPTLAQTTLGRKMFEGTLTQPESRILTGGLRGDRPEHAPYLAEIPILKRLFVGRAYVRGSSELFLVVRPSIVLGDAIERS